MIADRCIKQKNRKYCKFSYYRKILKFFISWPRLLNFLLLLSCIIPLRCLSENLKTFSVSLLQCNITGLSETWKIILWNFGSEYIIPKLMSNMEIIKLLFSHFVFTHKTFWKYFYLFPQGLVAFFHFCKHFFYQDQFLLHQCNSNDPTLPHKPLSAFLWLCSYRQLWNKGVHISL